MALERLVWLQPRPQRSRGGKLGSFRRRSWRCTCPSGIGGRLARWRRRGGPAGNQKQGGREGISGKRATPCQKSTRRRGGENCKWAALHGAMAESLYTGRAKEKKTL